MIEILKALLVGVCVGIPVGPILVMVVQRTLCHGRKHGIMVGLGAAAGDMLFAAVGLLTLTLVRSFVEAHSAWIMLIGGILIALIGVGMLLRRVSVELPPDRRNLSPWACTAQAFVSTLSNPGALAAMLALLSVFGLGAGSTQLPSVLLAPVVGLGEWLYWLLVVFLLARYIRMETRTLRILSRIAGVLVCIFALVLIVRGTVLIIGH